MRLFRFLRRKKKKEAEAKKPEVEEKLKKEFPGISEAEQKRHVGKHVAIVNGKIVASASAARGALTAAKRKHSGKEIDLRYVGSERVLIKCKCLGES